MPNDHERRISTNEANIQSIGQVVIRVEDYMKSTSKENSEIIDRLARIETKQDDFKSYQENCDEDRQKLTDKVVAIEKKESHKAGQSSVTGVVIATITSAVIAGASALIGVGHK